MKSLHDKVAVVTGGGAGIGRATAKYLAAAGAKVAVVDLRADTAKDAAAELERAGGVAQAFTADVTKRDQIERLAADVKEALGPAAILVNNAGVMIRTQSFLDAPYSDLELAINVNLWGVWHCTRAFLPQLLAQPEACIVNVSSMGGLVGWMAQVPYSTSKFAIRGFSDALRMELLGTGIHVCAVYPAHVATNISDNSPSLSQAEKDALRAKRAHTRAYPVDKAGRRIVEGILKHKARVFLGSEVVLMDVLTRLFPESYIPILQPLVKKLLAGGTVDERTLEQAPARH